MTGELRHIGSQAKHRAARADGEDVVVRGSPAVNFTADGLTTASMDFNADVSNRVPFK